jgi:hypothetical protein
LGKGEKKLNFGRSFSFFQTFPPFLFGFIWWRFTRWAFFKNSVALRIRPGADVSVYFGAALNPLVLLVLPVSIVGVDAKVILVTSADPCRADDSTALLIGRSSQHPSIGFYFSSVLPSVGRHPFHFG